MKIKTLLAAILFLFVGSLLVFAETGTKIQVIGFEPDTSGNCREILDEIDFRCLLFIDGYCKR